MRARVGAREIVMIGNTVAAVESWLVSAPVPGAVPDPERPREIKAPSRPNTAEKMPRCDRLIRARKYFDAGWPIETALLVPVEPWLFCGGKYRRAYKTLMGALTSANQMSQESRSRFMVDQGMVNSELLWLWEVLPISNYKDAKALLTYVGAHGLAREQAVGLIDRRFNSPRSADRGATGVGRDHRTNVSS
ncbi:MAG: hypothetical protein HGA39_09815 [Coriobacteriia bacterium]|nr:hypothetical protein [Coriobacteriia bacterium]